MATRRPPAFESYPHTLAYEDGCWWITFPDLPGCMSDGTTEAEAVANGRDAFASWMHSCLADGHPVPKPRSITQPPALGSGRLLARLPKTLHGRLAQEAAKDGVSLNQLLTLLLAEGLARRA